MRLVTHPTAVALGLTNLCLLPVVAPLLSPSHSVVYHMAGRASTVLVPILIFLGLVWLAFLGLLLLGKREGRIHQLVWTGVITMLPWVAMKAGWSFSSRHCPHPLSLAVFGAGVLTFFIITALWQPSHSSSFFRAQHFTATILGFVSLSGLLLVAQLCWLTWQTRAMNAPQPMHHYRMAAAGIAADHHPHVLWLIFDELSYRQVYEHRFPGLKLPAFDRLAAQSTVFTQTVPAGLMTEIAVPSLISGVAATAVRASIDGRQIELLAPDGRRWQHFDAQQTVFHDATMRGYATGAVGWYNPYCRILSGVLDGCHWSYHYGGPTGMSTDQSMSANLGMPFRSLWDSATHYFTLKKFAGRNEVPGADVHIQDYRDLFAEADTMLDASSTTQTPDFLFLHLPVPHPGGIYNRRTGELTTGPSTYLDNLALADAYLGHLRTKLEQRGDWERSTILIMGDHSWRTSAGPRWATESGWTGEEQAASDGGKFDNRPAYILKLPSQQQSMHIDSRFPAVETRALLDAIMDGQIRSPQELSIWVDRQLAIAAPKDEAPKDEAPKQPEHS